jgi:hypothetical protein
MGIQSFTPSGGGGTPGFDYIASVRMETYNRSWSQTGAAGTYILTSNNLSNGYAYFIVGGTTYGTPLGQVINIPGTFTRIDIVAPVGDYISLNKVAVKSTTVFNNALAGFSSFPSVITSSGNYVLPNNALPLINVVLGGAGGGGGGSNHGGGGGGGGSVVKLSAYQAVGTTAIVIGGGGGEQSKGGDTYFGNVYALGGGGGATHANDGPSQGGANGGGAGGWSGYRTGASGVTQTASTGLGTKGSPQFIGGYKGGDASNNGDAHNNRGGGGAGAAGNGFNGAASSGGEGGPGHVDTTTAPYTFTIGAGGQGRSHYNRSSENYGTHSGAQYGHGGHGRSGDWGGPGGGGNGLVVVRYYIP